ncbi:MAG: ribosomal-protein-alanine N-acetyltransferase [Chloroflexi bacterium]|nr:ribosomal-protein-alanine N-acetyltransferase [Chloroflexota bacterium]|tara:strand:+ start:1261 stop:1860 length:600 start_codon:yes stop_codon:yes gene_type:complete
MKVEPKYRNVVSSDAKELSKIESHIFTMDNLKTNFKDEIRKESKKIFVCTIEKRKKNQGKFITIIKNIYNLFSKTKNDLEINSDYDELIIGYAKVWTILDEIHIEQIGVIDRYRKQGIGEQLFLLCVKYSIESGSKKMLLECRNSNIAAINLYKKYLFKITSIRKNYYPYKNFREDAICFESPEIQKSFYKKLIYTKKN